MPAEKNTKPTQEKANPKAEIKKLESELKLAFKESKFDDVRKIAENLQKLDPDNGMAKKLLGKAEDAEAAAKAKKNAGKIQELEGELMLAFKQGDIPKVSDMIDKIRELDPKNKKCGSIETKILKAKASLDMQVKKEKMKTIMSALKELLKMSQWDRAVEEANKLMKLEWNHSVAMKAFKMAAKEKGVEVNSLITVKESKKKAEKKGFFARIFKKKDEAKPAEAKEEKKEDDKTAVAKSEVKHEESKEKDEKKPELSKPEAKKEVVKTKEDEKADKEKLKTLAKDLKTAVKEVKEEDAKKLIDELKKLDPASKLIEKSNKALEKAVTKKAEKEKKEKVKTLSKELKELQKSKDWSKVKDKAEELFQVDEKSKLVEKAVKQIEKETGKKPELKKAPEPKPAMGKSEEKSEIKKPGANILKAPEKPGAAKPATSAPAKPEAKKEGADKPNLFAKVVADEKKKEAESSATTQKAATPAPVAKPATPATPAPAKPAVAPIAPMAAPKAATPATPAPAKPAVAPIAPLAAKPAVPVAAIAPAAAGVKPMMPAAPKPATPAPVAGKPAAKPAEGEKGNIFTSLFGKEEKKEKGSIIDTIVEKGDKKEEAKKGEKKKKESTGVGLLKFSTALLQLSVLFIAISAGFFYVQHMDEENRVLALAGIESNNASTLKAAADELGRKDGEEDNLNKEIVKYKEDYNDDLKKVIAGVIESRLDWPDLLKTLNEVTESVYEKNALLGYVEYNNYSYNMDTKTLSVSATLSDPQGRNLTKLAELEEAFTYYPVDRDNPDDDREPYFYGMQEFTSYAKTFNSTTGRYMSSFSLSLRTEKGDEKK